MAKKWKPKNVTLTSIARLSKGDNAALKKVPESLADIATRVLWEDYPGGEAMALALGDDVALAARQR